MARTPSNMLALETKCPEFSLPDVVSGRNVGSLDFNGRPLLVMFICNHCPFVKHVRDKLAEIGRVYGSRVGIVAINSNDVANYPDDSPEKMKVEARDAGYTFPYLFDETQAVARSFAAACTPDFYVFDRDHRLAYRGQLDGSRPGNDLPVSGVDLTKALDALLAGGRPSADQRPSLGCNIKWK